MQKLLEIPFFLSALTHTHTHTHKALTENVAMQHLPCRAVWISSSVLSNISVHQTVNNVFMLLIYVSAAFPASNTAAKTASPSPVWGLIKLGSPSLFAPFKTAEKKTTVRLLIISDNK